MHWYSQEIEKIRKYNIGNRIPKKQKYKKCKYRCKTKYNGLLDMFEQTSKAMYRYLCLYLHFSIFAFLVFYFSMLYFICFLAIRVHIRLIMFTKDQSVNQ